MHTSAKPQKKKLTPKEEAERRSLIDSLCGKYAFVKTSADDFARRKAEEIHLEQQRGNDQGA